MLLSAARKGWSDAAGASLMLNGYRLREANFRLANGVLAIDTRDLDKVGLARLFREMSESDNR